MSGKTILLLALALGVLAQDNPFNFCTESTCQECPVGVTSSGTGYPSCVIYNSDDIFPGNGFNGSEGGGWAPFIDVAQPNQNCRIIVKSPADTTLPGCGYTIASYSNAVCGALDLEQTFMVQFCCGFGDCEAAQTPTSAKFRASIGGASSGAMYLTRPDGTIIKPAYEGPAVTPPETRSIDERSPAILQKRDCAENSWVALEGYEEYTRPADSTQIVLNDVRGPGMVTVTKSRTQSWTTTISASIGFEDVLSLGLSFESSFTESITNEQSYTFQVAEGETGDLGFTPYLRCSRGTGTCNNGPASGEVCTPYNGADGNIAGIYAVVQNS